MERKHGDSLEEFLSDIKAECDREEVLLMGQRQGGGIAGRNDDGGRPGCGLDGASARARCGRGGGMRRPRHDYAR